MPELSNEQIAWRAGAFIRAIAQGMKVTLSNGNYSKDHDAIVSISATLSAIKDVSVQQHSEEMKAISNLYQVILQHIEASKSTSSNSLTNSHNLVQVPDTGRSFRNPHASSVESAN